MTTHTQSVMDKRTYKNVRSTDTTEYKEPKPPPYMDTGWAWMVLIACFACRMLTDGLFWSFGIFLVAWEEQLSGSVTKLQWILSLLLGTSHVSAIIGSALCKKYSIRQVVFVGATLATLSFFIASFATSLWHLYVTFAFAGIGMGIMLEPAMVILVYYFKRTLARANGLAHTGVGLALFVMPPLSQFLIDRYGWNGALLIISGLVANNGVCAALFRPSPLEHQIRNKSKMQSQENAYIELIKTSDSKTSSVQSCENHNQDLPIVNSETKQRTNDTFSDSFDINLLKNIRCLCLFISFVFFGISYTLFTTFLPARADDVGISKYLAALLVSIMGLGSCTARLTHGYILDYNLMTATGLMVVANLINALCCVLNPLGNQYTYLAVLSAVFGMSSGVANSLVPIVAKEYAGMHRVSGAVAFILVTFGLGSVLGSYMAGVLFDATKSYNLSFFLAGASFAVCALLIFAKPLTEYIKNRHKATTMNQEIASKDISRPGWQPLRLADEKDAEANI